MNDKKLLLQAVDGTDEVSLSSDENENIHINEVEDTEAVDIDEFLKRGGECGRFQILFQSLIMFAMMPMVFPVMMFYYIGHTPSWTCTKNVTYSFNSTCSFNSSHIFDRYDKERCHLNRTEWQHDYPGRVTLVTEFDLVCNRAWLDALSGSIVFLGWGIGIIITGILSDMYGRKKVMFPCLFLSLICLLLHAFVKNMWQLVVIRFFTGVFYSSPALNNFILIVELIGPNRRTLAAAINNCAWPLGALLLTLKAYYIKDWRTIVIICSAPYLLGVLTAFCIPESVRWLNVKGRTKEAEDILHRAARINKRRLPHLSLKPAETEIKHGKKASYIDLFRSCKRVKLVLAQAFIWFQAGMTYYGLSWAFDDLGGDMYVNFILSFLVELPGNLLAMFLVHKCGRKKTTIVMSICSVLSCFGVVCTPKKPSLNVLRICFGLSGKFMISNVFNCIYIWSSEIYPTAVRTQGMGINIVTSRIGAAMSPFLKLLNKIHVSAPFVLMTVTSIIATLLCLPLPETLGKPTRETLDDLISGEEESIQMRAMFSLNNDTVEFNETESFRNDDVFGIELEEEVEETDCLLAPHTQILPTDKKT